MCIAYRRKTWARLSPIPCWCRGCSLSWIWDCLSYRYNAEQHIPQRQKWSIVNEEIPHQWCILPSTMHYSANDKLHHKYCITSSNPALKTKRQISDFWYLVQVFGRSNCAKSQIAFLYRNWLKKLFKVLRQIVTMKQICQHLRLQMKIMCRKFHIKTPFTFWVMR